MPATTAVPIVQYHSRVADHRLDNAYDYIPALRSSYDENVDNVAAEKAAAAAAAAAVRTVADAAAVGAYNEDHDDGYLNPLTSSDDYLTQEYLTQDFTIGPQETYDEIPADYGEDDYAKIAPNATAIYKNNFV